MLPLSIAIRFLVDIYAGIKHWLGNVHVVNSHIYNTIAI